MGSVINWTALNHAQDMPVRAGDKVSCEAGGMPIFLVIKLDGDQLWLDDEAHRTVVRPLDAFRWVARSL